MIKPRTRWLLLPSLASMTGIVAIVLGVLMSVGGAALAVAVLSTPQPRVQIVTAAVLAVAGVVNVRAGAAIRRGEPRGLVWSFVATVTLMLYLGVGVDDYGEPLWLHAAYLILLLAVASGKRTRRTGSSSPLTSAATMPRSPR
jgi:hypothetical protein